MNPVDARQGAPTKTVDAAARLRGHFQRRGIVCLNLLASPGAGTTTLLEHTLQAFAGGRHRLGVLSAGEQSERDAARLARFGFPTRQVVGGGPCPVDAGMVERALAEIMPLEGLDLLFIESAGNPVCPDAPDLGETATVVVLSVVEGDDKPLKYGSMLRRARVMLLHKMDLLPYTRFDVPAAKAGARRANPAIEIVETSCVGAPGLRAWFEWIERVLRANAGRHAQV